MIGGVVIRGSLFESPLVGKFEQIHEGMTLDQVERILGSPNGPECGTCWPQQDWWDDGEKMIVVKHEPGAPWRVTSKELTHSVRQSWFLSWLRSLRGG